MFLDAPGNGEFDVSFQDLLEAFSLPDGEPVPGAGEQLAVAPRWVDQPAPSPMNLPGPSAAHIGKHLIGKADHVPVIGADFGLDRKSTRLNSSHVASSYAVFC